MAGAADEIIVRLTAEAGPLAAGLQTAADAVEEAAAQMAAAGQAATEGMTAGTAEASGAWDALAANVAASTDAAKASIAAMADSARAQLGLMDEAAQASAAAYAELIAAQNAQTVRMGAQDASAGIGGVEGLSGASLAQDAQMEAAIAREEASLRLKSAMSGEIGTAEGAAAAEVQLDAAYEAGAISADQYAAAIARLNIAQEENAASSEVDGAAHKFRFHGLYGTVAQGMNLLLSPARMLAATLGSLALAEGIAAGKMGELNLALLANGDAAGVTGAEMNAWSNDLAASMGTVQDARNAYSTLAESGIFIGRSLQDAGRAALEWSEVTGTSSQQAATAIEHMAENPVEAIKNLTSAQAQEVESLLEMGHKAEAGRVAVASLSADLNAQESAIQANIPWWDKWGDAIANAAEKGGEALKNMVGLGDLPQRIQDAKDKLHSDEQGGWLHYILGGPLAPHASPLQLLRDRAQLHLLESDLHTREQAAQAHAEGHRARMGAVEASAQLHALDMAEHPHAAAVQRVDEMLRKVVEGNGALPAGVYQNGTTFSGPGFEELVRAAGGTRLPKGEHHQAAPYHPEMTSWVPQSITNELMRTQQTQVDEAVAATKTTQESQSAHHVAMLDTQRQHIQAMVSMGTLGGSAAIAQEQSIADQIYQIKLAELEKEKALAATKPEETARINSEIVRLQDAHTATMVSLSDKVSAQQIKDAQGQVSPMLSAFAQVTTGFVEGTLTRQQAEMRLGEAIVAHEIQWGIQKLANHIAIDNAKTLVTAEGEAKRLALHVWAEAEAGAVHALHAVEWIVTEAAKAAASAFTALAGIPVVGPALAVAASVAAGAEVLSLVGKVASAEGGWDRVPYDGAPALLHKDEMVLPADLAEGVRNMSGGGGSVTNHFHIQAWDGRSMGDFVRRNPAMLTQWAQHAHRTGFTAA